MAAEVYRIEINLDMRDNTADDLGRAQRNLSAFERHAERTQQRLQQMGRTRWQLTLHALDRATPVIERVGGTLRNITGRTWRISLSVATAPLRALDWVWRRLTSIQSLVAAFLASQAFRHGILGPLALESRLQRARIGFETFLGSAQRAQRFIAELQRFAAETPFEMLELLDWSVQLLPVFRGNTEMVLRTLRAFGDAAAMTGAGVQGMSLALLGFRQIATMGRLQMEELRQVTENLLVPLEPILEELGIAKEDLKDLGKKGISAARAMEAILRALERPVERGGFLGGMSRQMATLENQVARLRDNLTMRFVQPWGRGLASGVAAALGRVSDWFERNRTTVERWSQEIEQAGRLLGDWFAQRVERFFARLQSLVADPTAMAEPQVLNRATLRAWEESRREYVRDLARAVSPAGDIPALNRAIRRAMEAGPRMPEPQPRQLSLGEWMRLAWDRLIVEPFEQWWGSGGQEKVRRIAEKLGAEFGSALGRFIAAALGGGRGTEKGAERESMFADVGAVAGRAFMEGFLREVDANKVAERILQLVKKSAIEASKIAPGGAPATALSWVSAFGIGMLFARIMQIFQGVARAYGGVRSAAGWLGRVFAGLRRARTPQPPAPPPPAAGVPIYGPRGEVLTTAAGAADEAARSIAAASRAGRGAGILRGVGRLFQPLALVSDALAIARARGAARIGTIGQAAGGWGGAFLGGALGAKLGSLIAPGPGTLVGSIIGSIFGSLGGARLGGALMSRLAGGALAQLPARVGAIVSGIVGRFQQIPAAVGRALAGLPGLVMRFVGRIPYFFGFAVGTAVRLVQTGLGNVVRFFASLPGRVGTFLITLPGRVRTVFAQVRATMGGLASSAVNAVVRFFASLPGRAGTLLSNVAGRVRAAGRSWAAAAREAAGQLIRGVISTIQSLPGRVGGIMERALGRLRSYGQRLKQTAERVFSRFVEGYRAGVGEHSPSYIERSMFRIADVSRSTVAMLGADLYRMAAAVGPRMRALYSHLQAQPAAFSGQGAALQAMARTAPQPAPSQQVAPVAVPVQAGSGPVMVQVQVQPAVTFNVTVDGGNPDQVVQALERHARRVAKVLADPMALEIGRGLLKVQPNMLRTARA